MIFPLHIYSFRVFLFSFCFSFFFLSCFLCFCCFFFLLKHAAILKERPPPPPPHRTRGYICSFPITRTPLSRGKRINPSISGSGYHSFGIHLEIFPRLPPKFTPLSRENGNTHAAPSCIPVKGGGGGRDIWTSMHDKETKQKC